MAKYEDCPKCLTPYEVARGYSIYHKGIFYTGHKYCMNAYYQELEYPREKPIDRDGKSW